MSIAHAIVYGLVQGLTEFLPVSSSAHLILLPTFTGWEDPGLAFDVALHWGTLIGVILYFRREMVEMIGGFLGSLKGERAEVNIFPWKIVVATVPGALMGLLFEKQAEHLFRAPWILAITLSVMGICLLVADRWGAKSKSLSELSWSQAFLIGVGQGFAIVPGVSRSGVTITLALLFGLERSAAVRFSFFLSIPIILGAGLLKFKYLIHNIGDPSIVVAIISSAVFGLLAVHLLITYVRTKSFTPFVIYRLILSASIVTWLILTPTH